MVIILKLFDHLGPVICKPDREPIGGHQWSGISSPSLERGLGKPLWSREGGKGKRMEDESRFVLNPGIRYWRIEPLSLSIPGSGLAMRTGSGRTFPKKKQRSTNPPPREGGDHNCGIVCSLTLAGQEFGRGSKWMPKRRGEVGPLGAVRIRQKIQAHSCTVLIPPSVWGTSGFAGSIWGAMSRPQLVRINDEENQKGIVF